MTDTSQEEVPPQTNGINDGLDDEERAKMRPADIDADVREMERRKRVELIMNSKLFREELERIIETQLREGSGTSALMQQISDMMGVSKQSGNVFKSSSCVVPINDIRGIESMGYAKGEKILRCKLASVYRIIDLYGWTTSPTTLVTARLNQDEEHFLVNPYGMLFHEITASSLVKVDMQGGVVEQGTTNFSVNITAFSLHAAVHAARPDIKCIIHVHTPSVVAISALKQGLLPISKEAVVIGDVSTHAYLGGLLDAEEIEKIARNLGPNNKVLLLSNQGALCCGETIEEAFFNARNTVLASESQLKLLPVGIDNLALLSDEVRKKVYDAAHKPPESTPRPDQPSILEVKVERKWRVGGVEFEGLMRMLDNAGFRTGYIYRHPLVKGEPPRPKNDVEVPPAVSSLGYLLEEEELYRQGLWRKLEGGRKGHDRSRWLNSPNVYQKVEILETGTPDPKKITKWVAEPSPTHSSTPVKIDSALQFVPKNTNPKEFKLKQQQIKDYRRADKISAGPQSHILEGVTWEEARKMQDAGVTQTGDQVVLMGAASKGIIQRGHQHNATVYKAPYAKNPFDSVTDEELDEYKKVVEKKVKGEYDTDFSESELSSAHINKRMDGLLLRSPTSETEEESREEHRVLRIETKQAPKPSQPEVVLSDDGMSPTEQFLRNERVSVNNYKSHTLKKIQRPEFCYRTNNFAGFPKGAYANPHPTHFNILLQKPKVVTKKQPLATLGSITSLLHQSNSQVPIPKVTINIGDIHSVSVKIPLNMLGDLFTPLQFNLPPGTSLIQTNSQQSQTTYINSPTYEEQILDHLKNCLINDMNDVSCVSDFSTESLNNVGEVSERNGSPVKIITPSETNSIKEFKEEDSVTINESLYDISSLETFAASFFTKSSSNSNDSSSEIDEENQQPTERHLSITSNFDLFKKVVDEAKQILESVENGVNNNEPSTTSYDEGIGESEDSILEKPQKYLATTDESVINLSELIFDYLVQQCFEVKELILFPELLYDENINKLLNKLSAIYSESYANNLNNTEKNELRLNIFNYVFKKLELDERLNNSSSDDSFSSSNVISDKLFTLSEFVSDILDIFFTKICSGTLDNESFNNFFKSDCCDVLQHSTPELINYSTSKILCKVEENNSTSAKSVQKRNINEKTSPKKERVTVVNSFKKGTKVGSELYWISITPPVGQSEVKRAVKGRKIVNVDDIPLRPPLLEDEDTVSQQCSSLGRALSPVPEEPRCCLFGDDYVDEDEICTNFRELNEDSNDDSFNNNNFPEILDNFFGCGDNYNIQENVLASQTVIFRRNKRLQTPESMQSVQTVTLFRNENSDKTLDSSSESYFSAQTNQGDSSSEGNWMGYEAAKF